MKGVLLALPLLAVAGGIVPAAGQGAKPVPCPVAGVDRLGRSAGDLLDEAAATAASRDPGCRALGRAVADLVLARGEAAEGAWERLRQEEPAGPPALPWKAVAAALAFRAGHLRPAHRLAREVLRVRAGSALAWLVLGRVLAARFRDGPAREAFRRVLAIDPGCPGALRGLASLSGDRREKVRLLERYLAVAGGRGEPWDRVRGARDHLALLRVLGDRPVFVLERADLPGTIPLRVLPGTPGRPRGFILEADLGGRRPVPLLFDTGASGLHLEDRSARRAGFQPLAGATLVGGGGTGRHAVTRGIVRLLGLGPVVYRDALATVTRESLERRGAYRGILGADLLGGTRLLFRPGPPALRVVAADRAEGAADPLSVDPWAVPPGDLPVLRIEGQLLVRLRFGAGRERREGLFVLDTGASRTILAAGPAGGLPGMRRGGGTGRIRAYGGETRVEGRVPLLWLGIPGPGRSRAPAAGRELRDVPVVDPGPRVFLSGTRVAGWLGLDVLARGPFELDLGGGSCRLPAPSARRRRGVRRRPGAPARRARRPCAPTGKGFPAASRGTPAGGPGP